jgi:hypothetical protein
LKPGANVCKDRYVKKEEKNISCFISGFEEDWEVLHFPVIRMSGMGQHGLGE